MAGASTMQSSSAGSATPTQKPLSAAAILPSSPLHPATSLERVNLDPQHPPNGYRNISASAVSFGPRGSSLNPAAVAGSFGASSRLTAAPSRSDFHLLEKLDEDDDGVKAEEALGVLREALKREEKIKEGSENMLEALNTKKAKQTKEQRVRVEAELCQAIQRIKDLRQKISDAQRILAAPATPTRHSFATGTDVGPVGSGTVTRSPLVTTRSGAASDFDDLHDVSPSFTLTDILHSLDLAGMAGEYYVSRTNRIVELFKRHPTLRYDLSWLVLGPKIQALLLHCSQEVVAAGYRMARYAISDVVSLRKLRGLNTDVLVILSLTKEKKASLEREQALKFVRAFLDVKDGGVGEISRAVVRTIVSIAEHADDRLMSICIETLAEILVRDPQLLIASGGLSVLSEAISEGQYKSPSSLAVAYLFLLDHPLRRRYFTPGCELEVLFTTFTDEKLAKGQMLKQNAMAILVALRSWPGLMTLSMFDLRAIRSLVASLMLPSSAIKETVLDMVYKLLRIKSPDWASSFLAGRRLTTYGRVTTLKSSTTLSSSRTSPSCTTDDDDVGDDYNFVDHYTALLLAVFLRAGLLNGLLVVTKEDEIPTLKRKATLLLVEVLKLASRLLPPSWSCNIQLLPELFMAAAEFDANDYHQASQLVYQISSVSRILQRSTTVSTPSRTEDVNHGNPTNIGGPPDEQQQQTQQQHQQQQNQQHSKGPSSRTVVVDDAAFRQMLMESAVLSSAKWAKWNWDTIYRIVEGPLANGKRLEEALKASKFLKRIMSFYRPYKCRFSELKNNRGNQKYVRAGCTLMATLLLSSEGTKYLIDSKLLKEIRDCLMQYDPTSNASAIADPLFSADSLTDTLAWGYFAMLGVLTSDPRGLQMLDKLRIFSIISHIIDRQQRPDLIKLLLSHFDYTLLGHPRLFLSKALTACQKNIRIHATNLLRKYALRAGAGPTEVSANSKWAIKLLVTQLYDPEVEVCATAVQILEKASNNKSYLEYVVECRPSLDHLGEIGAPLLLRFLSTSVGYHYLDGLDYISNEMDDWFLGRNDNYVAVVEASLARAFSKDRDDTATATTKPALPGDIYEDGLDVDSEPHVPPHFYRELTRTKEGCQLLRQKRHFNDFANTIREFGMQYDDAEMIVKVKGCMWAVGNVGSMELGAEFLESTDVVECIMNIACRHELMSMRGTAFFVLGLISRSLHGLEMLSEHGWDSNTSVLGESLGFCIPTQLDTFLNLQPWQHEPVSAIVLPGSQRSGAQAVINSADLIESEKSSNRRILTAVVSLSNAVLFRSSMTELLLLRKEKAAGFRQVGLFCKVLMLLERHHYRLNVRMAVIECFDKSVVRNLVLGGEPTEYAPRDETSSL